MPQSLEDQLATVRPVPPAAAEAYRDAGPKLVAWVNGALKSHPDPKSLIGDNPLLTALDNHANHFQFMSTVFRLNNTELLARVLPWVYKAYSARGFSLDYFRFVLQSFSEATREELLPEQAASILGVYDGVIAQHSLIAALAENEEPPPPMDTTWLARMHAFCDVLLAGDAHRAVSLAREWVQSSEELVPFFELVVTGAMIEVGRRWEADEISVAQEHLATSIVNRILASFYPQIVRAAPTRGRALVTCAANEQHELGSRVFADLLELDGWDVRHLGANTPTEELVDFLRQTPVRFVALSVVMPFNLDRAAETVARLQTLEADARPRVLLGGRAFSLAPTLWMQVGGDAYGATASAGLAIARVWAEDQRAASARRSRRVSLAPDARGNAPQAAAAVPAEHTGLAPDVVAHVARMNDDMTRLVRELHKEKAAAERALAQAGRLEGPISICSYCSRVQDEQGNWQQLEQYVVDHSDAWFSHGICPRCFGARFGTD